MENTIFIGEKELQRYITTALILKNSGAEEIEIKARGRLIKKAVDVAEILRRRYFIDAERFIDIGTEEVPVRDDPEGKTLFISTISIIYVF